MPPDAGPRSLRRRSPEVPVLRLRLLGETAIDIDGLPVGPDSQVIFAVLLVLCLERGKRIARTALHRLLWPAAGDDSGRHNLRQVAYKLRQLGVPLDATQSSLMIPAAAVGGELVELLAGDPAVGARLLAGRRVGDLLPGYAPTFSPAFADWIDEQRGLLHSQLRRALLAAVAEARAAGRWREVEAIAREVLRFDALNEEATLALAEATALAGAKTEAIGIIDRFIGEVGARAEHLQLPASLLRRRIAERFPAHKYVSAADRCFVGRAAEMAKLMRDWSRAKDRRGGAVLLWGEPGIGKTRLAQELGKVAVLQGAQVQRVASRSWDAGRPLGAIVDMVGPLRELPGGAGVDPQCNAYLDRLTKHDPTRPLTDLPDPVVLHRMVRQSVFDLVDALVTEAPLVLVFEDVQWLDASSWEMLAELLRMARTRRLLLVLTSRESHPPQLPESEDWEALRRLRVTGLDAAAANELVDAMTREAGRYMDAEYREWCVPLAGGNPLYVQEVALQWLEKGGMREAPRNVISMIASRIFSLPDHSLRALQILALAVGTVSARLIAAVLGEPFTNTLKAIDHLSHTGLLDINGERISVRHDVIAQISIEHLSPPARLLLHDRLAKASRSAFNKSGTSALLWDSYRHWRLAQLQSEAVDAALALSEHLTTTGQTASSIDVLNDALEWVDNGDLRFLLQERIISCSVHLGLWTNIERIIASRPVDEGRTTETILHHIQARWRRETSAETLYPEAARCAERSGLPVDLRVRAATWAHIFAENCTNDASPDLLDERIRPLLNRGDCTSTTRLHYELLYSARSMSIDALETFAYQLRDASRGLSDRTERARLLRHAARGLEWAGMVACARDTLLEALADCEQAGASFAKASCEEYLAVHHIHLNDVEAARYWIERSAVSYGSTEDTMSEQAINFVRLQLDVLELKIPSALTALERLGALSAVDEASPTLAYLNRLSARVRLDALVNTHTATEPNMLDKLQSAFVKARWADRSDFAAAAIAHGLIAAGNANAAREYLRQYLDSWRVRRGPLHPDLECAIKLASA